jgi:hypothetical protein
MCFTSHQRAATAWTTRSFLATCITDLVRNVADPESVFVYSPVSITHAAIAVMAGSSCIPTTLVTFHGDLLFLSTTDFLYYTGIRLESQPIVVVVAKIGG